MKLDLKPYEEKMKKALSVYDENLAGIRAGRANANVLSKITVDYYGSPTAITAVASISQPTRASLRRSRRRSSPPTSASLLRVTGALFVLYSLS